LLLIEILNVLPEERINAVFRGEKPDVMPWFADLTYWYHAHLTKGDLPEKYRGDEGRLRLYQELGCGAHEELYGPVVKVSYKTVKTRTFIEELKGGSRLERIVFETPLGTLIKVRKYSPVSYSSATVKYPIETDRDLKVLKYIYENIVVEPNHKAYEKQLKLMKMWRGWGIVSSLPPRTPFLRMIIEWAGVMNTYRLVIKAGELFDEVIETMMEADDPIYEAIREAPAEYVYFGENLSSDIVSPRLFRKYCFNYYKKRVEQLHAAGKKIYVHIDGRLRGLLKIVPQTGVDCVQSLTPAPVGDIPLEDFRKEAGQQVILWGGLPGVYFSTKYREELLLNTIYNIIRYYLTDCKFIVGVADQVPPDGDLNRVKKISKIVESEGKIA